MPNFTFRYKKKSTGKLNRGSKYARSERHLREILAADPDIEEIVSVLQAEESPATERQLEYLFDLGGGRPVGLNVREASDLIDNANRNRQPGSEADRRLAERFAVEVTKFTSKAGIFERITGGLLDRGDVDGLARWYVYRVYRTGFDRSAGGGIDSSDHPALVEVAARLAANLKASRSLKRAASSTVSGFRWFGEFVAAGGVSIVGDSERTEAYQFAHSALQHAGLLRAVGSAPAIASYASPSASRAQASDVPRRVAYERDTIDDTRRAATREAAPAGKWRAVAIALFLLVVIWLMMR